MNCIMWIYMYLFNVIMESVEYKSLIKAHVHLNYFIYSDSGQFGGHNTIMIYSSLER